MPKRKQQYWLMKSEPGDFSIEDLERVGSEPWTGVRNYMARNFMLSMHEGDGVLFYHSACKVPGVYGLAEVAGQPYPDPTQFDSASKYHDETSNPDDPRWWLVDVRYVRTLAEPITLERIRTLQAKLGDGFALTRKGNRLSVLPVSAKQWKILLALEGKS